MTDRLNRMAELCRQRNGMVMASYALGQISMDTFAQLQAQKVLHNRQTGSLKDAADFEDAAEAYARKLLGDAEAAKLREALKEKAICTADHHGSLYCSQFLQSDLLFALIMEKLGTRNPYVPVLAAGQVELENSTYARGFCAYRSRENKQFLPLFPAKYSVTLASHVEPVSSDMVDRFRKRFTREGDDLHLRDVLGEMCRDLYDPDDVRNAETFADQTTLVGRHLMDHLFAEDAPAIRYLEMETILLPLLLNELSDERSLVHRFLYDPDMRAKLIGKKLPDGLSLADLLFRGADEKGRKFMLSLTEEGTLTGKDWRKEPVCFETDPDALIPLLQEKKVFPGVFTETLMLLFERGITWIGGMFQAVYMPQWQSAFSEVLEECGLAYEADLIRSYDCTGYSCGPMMMLYGGDGFATTAGPVELWKNPVSFETVRQLAAKTMLWDAHRIGLSEMYFDLTVRDEREPDWYRTIAEEVYRAYPENVVADDRQ